MTPPRPTDRKTHRLLALALLAGLVATLAAPTAAAAWSSSETHPASFRPGRTVVFSYTASSNSATDQTYSVAVQLHTCKDTNGDGRCALGDARLVSQPEQSATILGGGSQTFNFNVNLPEPEDPQMRFDYTVRCATGGSVCGGGNPLGAGRQGNFALVYTNTWLREIIATSPVPSGTTQTVTYRLTSTSVDDRPLAGTAELFSRPNGGAERSEGTKSVTAPPNAVTNVQWTGVSFTGVGPQRERVTHSEYSGADLTRDVTVQGVHLHVLQPRSTYEQGEAFSLYFEIHGHGSTPDPSPISGATITLRHRNGTYQLAQTTTTTDANGRAFATFLSPFDLTRDDWTATTTVTFVGNSYTVEASGTALFQPPAFAVASPAVNLTSVEEGIRRLESEGVHLDEIGIQNIERRIAQGSILVLATIAIGVLCYACATRLT